MKQTIKKVMLNILMAMICIAIGIGISTALYSAGFAFVLPKITIEYETKDHDLVLIDRAQTAQVGDDEK